MATIQIADRVRGIAVNRPLLQLDEVSKSFGQDCALANLNLSINTGEVIGLIGPRQSGKSTLIDIIAGTIKPSLGLVRIAGEDVTGLGLDSRSRRGIVYCMKPSELFLDLTAVESVVMAGLISQPPFFSRRGGKTYREEALSTLAFVGLAGVGDVRGQAFSPHQQRLLTIAVALAAKPSLLLLDGPAAGMTGIERLGLASLIAAIRDTGTSVLISEHDMPLLTGVCDRFLVMDSGRLIADDVAFRIARNPAVLNAYSCLAQ